MHQMEVNVTHREKALEKFHQNAAAILKTFWKQQTAKQQQLDHLPLISQTTQDMLSTAGKGRTNS